MHCFNSNLLSHALDFSPPFLTRLLSSSSLSTSVSVPADHTFYPHEPMILALQSCRLLLSGPVSTLPTIQLIPEMPPAGEQ